MRGQVKSENSSLSVAVRVSKTRVLKLTIDDQDFFHSLRIQVISPLIQSLKYSTAENRITGTLDPFLSELQTIIKKKFVRHFIFGGGGAG